MGQQGAHHQPQGVAVAAGGAPALQPLQQRRRWLGGLLGLESWRRLDAQAGQEGAGIVETGAAIAEAIETGIEGRQQGFQLLDTQLRQGLGARLGRGVD
jgi:hypothetical protein